VAGGPSALLRESLFSPALWPGLQTDGEAVRPPLRADSVKRKRLKKMNRRVLSGRLFQQTQRALTDVACRHKKRKLRRRERNKN